jgi:formylmethanofuran dehydrogenase subunit E
MTIQKESDDVSGRNILMADMDNPVICSLCGGCLEFSDATRDDGYVICPACLGAETK